MSQLKFSLKSESTFWLEGDGPRGPISWLRPCPRPQKTFPDRTNQASYADFAQSCRNYAGNRKPPDYYRLSSQGLLHPKLES